MALREGEYLENGRRKLKNVEINPGRLCNNKCLFCMSGEERDDHAPWATFDRMKSEIELQYRAGARSLGFLGGEPSAYPHILDCMRFARGLGYQRIALCTNGVRLAQPRFVEDCLAAGMTRVTMSLHSHVPEVEELLTGVPRILPKKVEAVKNLVAARDAGRLPDNVSLNPVFCRPNAPHAEAYVRFFRSLGIDDIRFNFIWPESRARLDKNIVPRYRDVLGPILTLMLRNEKEWGMTLSFGSTPACVLPASVRRPELLRKYFFEEALDMPTEAAYLRANPEEGVQRFNWHRKSRDVLRAKVPGCSSCPYDAACMGVYRTYLELYGDEEFGP
jgi:MoaA/NifB/PqqE/SkfB family radical SAM enzyme